MSSSRTLATVLVTLGLTAAAAVAGEPRGPEFGSNKFTSGIADLSPVGLTDVDDFVGRLMAGETLTVSVTADKRSTLKPSITLIGPDGQQRVIQPSVKKNGAKVQLKKFLVDETGRWLVRLGALEGSRGDYSVAFKIGKAKTIKLKKQTLGGAGPPAAVHLVPGLDGAQLTLTLAASKKESLVTLRGLDDPAGNPVPGALAAATLKKTKTTLKKHVLVTGDGDYPATVGIDDGTGSYSLTLKIKAPRRPKGRKATALSEASDLFLLDGQAGKVGVPGGSTFVEGGNFSATVVTVGGLPALDVVVDGTRTRIDFKLPAGVPGTTVDLVVVSPDGQAACIDDFFSYLGAPNLTAAQITGGSAVINGNEVPFSGGTTLAITGTELHLLDTVTLGGLPIVPTNLTPLSFDVVAPAGPPGPVSLVVEDAFGRRSTLPDVLRYVGLVDASADRTPAPTAVDDFSGLRLALGDVDRDTVRNDVVLVTYGAYNDYFDTANSPGTRNELTRLLFFNSARTFVDRTANRIPAAGTDVTGVGEWNALGVAVGDLDGGGADVVVAGTRGDTWGTLSYIDYGDFTRLHVFLNGGVANPGVLRLSESDLPGSGYLLPQIIDSELTEEESGDPIPVTLRSARDVGFDGSAVALGDLDGDGDLDAVLGTTRFGQRTLLYDPADVDYGLTPPYINTSTATSMNLETYYSATRILENRFAAGGGFVDVADANLPSIGDNGTGGLPAFHARDIALGDVDGQNGLDIIVAWNNPDTVRPAGLRSGNAFYIAYTTVYAYTRPATPVPEIATRVLLNDGSGGFTDATTTWMPAASDPEFWQAHRVRLADLDGDGDLDMVLGHRRGLDAFKGGAVSLDRHSLRILRNERVASGAGATRFVDVTATALPALPQDRDDNLRGSAIAVEDVNGDGILDLVIGTREALEDDNTTAIASTRILFGRTGLTFVDGSPFTVPYATDSGEADDYLIGDLAGQGATILIVTEVDPRNSDGNRHLRAYEWRSTTE